jgi:flagellin-like protein
MEWNRYRRSRLRRSQRGISNIIATVLLVAITIVLVIVLAEFRPNLGQPPPSIDYQVKGGLSEQAWSDPTDCSNTTQYAHCNALPAIFVAVNGFTPSYLALAHLNLIFLCNGTDLINASLANLEVVPGTGASPPANAPLIGSCGTWSWGEGGPGAFTGTYFNRLLYYQQFTPGATGVSQGDVLVVFAHPTADFCDYSGNCPDDDYHGAPLWCFNVPGACTISVTYANGGTNDLVMSFSLYGLSRQ